MLARLGTVIGVASFLTPWLFVRGCRSSAEYTALEMAQEDALSGFLLTLLIAAPGILGLLILLFVRTKRQVLRRQLGRLKMVLAAIAALPALDTILTVLYTPRAQDFMELRWGAWASLVGYSLAGLGGCVTVLATGPPGSLSSMPSGKPDKTPVARGLHVLASLWAGLVALIVFVGSLSQAGDSQSPINYYLNYDSGTWLLLGTTLVAMLAGVVFLSFFVGREKGQRLATPRPLASASSVPCPACGKKTPIGEFCGWCGTRLSVPRQAGPPSGRKTSPPMGGIGGGRLQSFPQPVEKIPCLSCGRDLPPGSTFCGWCGASLAATEPARIMPVQENELLRQAIAAARAGRKPEARQMLEQILQANPGQEQAWTWMATVVETNAQRVECLQRVLAINPNNAAARKVLAQLESRVDAPPVAPQPTALPSSIQCPRCGMTNRAGARFCKECGQKLEQSR
jgi:tetratricopeptide (TPR) repeat protein